MYRPVQYFSTYGQKKKQASFETADLRLCQCPCFSGGDGSRKKEEEKEKKRRKIGKIRGGSILGVANDV